MEPFKKANELVDECEMKDNLLSVTVVINKERIKNAKYGKYVKPIQTTYKLEEGEDIKIQNPNYVFKIPSTCEDCLALLGTKYSVIVIDAKNKRSYIGGDSLEHSYYECSVGVIRNPIGIKQCEDVEAEAFHITEYQF